MLSRTIGLEAEPDVSSNRSITSIKYLIASDFGGPTFRLDRRRSASLPELREGCWSGVASSEESTISYTGLMGNLHRLLQLFCPLDLFLVGCHLVPPE